MPDSCLMIKAAMTVLRVQGQHWMLLTLSAVQTFKNASTGIWELKPR